MLDLNLNVVDYWAGPGARSLYYTEVKLGTPPKRYYVQVDTGSDILWVNCITCEQCPRKSGLGVPFPTFLFLFVCLNCRLIQLCPYFDVNAVCASLCS